MSLFDSTARYWHTLRFLKLGQFYWRVWFRLYRPRLVISVGNDVPLHLPQGTWQVPAARLPCLLGPWQFRFLNHSHTLPAQGGWNDTALYCRCAGLLGADPFEPGDALYTAISQTVAIVGQDIALEIFAVAEAPHVVQRAQWLHDQAQGAIKKSREVAKHASALKQSVRTAFAQDGKPWERGYAVAQQLRALLNLTPDMPMQCDEAVTQALFGAPAAVVSSIKDLELNSGARWVISQGSEGLGIAMPSKSGPLSQTQSQFQLAASFADFVFSGDSEIYLSTAAATDRQKANRAFAAEFLAPIQGIQEKWSSKKTPHTNVEAIADAFGVSPYFIRYQVQNQADELLTL